jgi:hypothetical protein
MRALLGPLCIHRASVQRSIKGIRKGGGRVAVDLASFVVDPHYLSSTRAPSLHPLACSFTTSYHARTHLPRCMCFSTLRYCLPGAGFRCTRLGEACCWQGEPRTKARLRYHALITMAIICPGYMVQPRPGCLRANEHRRRCYRRSWHRIVRS